MTPVLLPDLEAELRRAGAARLAERGATERAVSQPATAPRRTPAARRRMLGVLVAAAAGVVVAAGVGVAALTGTPIDRLLQSPQEFGQRPGTPRVDLTLVDPGGLRWTVAGYMARDGLISTTAAPETLRRLPGTGGASPGLLAAARRAGDYVSVSTTDALVGPDVHRLVSGLADGDVVRLVLTFEGQRRRARLSRDALTLRNGLVERVYAAGFVVPQPSHHRQAAPIRFDITLKDGRTRTSWSSRQCVGACGGSLPRIPGGP